MKKCNQRDDEIFISELLQTAINSGSEKKGGVPNIWAKSLRNNYEKFDVSVKMQFRMLQLY